ncbi:endonuclease [Metamycoplasma spumans]|uniref:endonuclease n=1 Tax=Metamycoplasma spumans TaxID=92406 RepID=UPI0034DD8BE1
MKKSAKVLLSSLAVFTTTLPLIAISCNSKEDTKVSNEVKIKRVEKDLEAKDPEFASWAIKGDNLFKIEESDLAKLKNELNNSDLYYSYTKTKIGLIQKGKKPNKKAWESMQYLILPKRDIPKNYQVVIDSGEAYVKENNKVKLNSKINFKINGSMLILNYRMAKFNGSNDPYISENVYESRIDLKSAPASSKSTETEKEQTNPINENKKLHLSLATLDENHELKYESSDFYQPLDGLSGEELRNQLFKLQKSHRNKTGSYNDLFSTYRDAFVDNYYEKDGSVLDIYEEMPNSIDTYVQWHGKFRDEGKKEGAGMNREHLVAQSWFAKAAPMRNDAHHVWPTDKEVNARHGNYPFGTVIEASFTSVNGTKVGKSAEDGGLVAEVIDEFKGDVARAFLYFTLTYKDQNLYNNNSATRFYENKKGEATIRTPFKNTMLLWAKKDNISQFDLDRNNGIFKHQRNRNPFIDYPELIDVVFKNDNNFVFKNKGIATKLVAKEK